MLNSSTYKSWPPEWEHALQPTHVISSVVEFFFFEAGSLSSFGWPGIFYVDQLLSPKLIYMPAFA